MSLPPLWSLPVLTTALALLAGCETHDRMVFYPDYRSSNQMRQSMNKPAGTAVPGEPQSAAHGSPTAGELLPNSATAAPEMHSGLPQ